MTQPEFRSALYDALVYALGTTLSRYDPGSARLLVMELGRRIRQYLGEHGFPLEDSESDAPEAAIAAIVRFFKQHGFVEELQVVGDEPDTIHAVWKGLLGFEAYRRIDAERGDVFISCPLNAVLLDALDRHKFTLTLEDKRFDTDAGVVETWEALVPVAGARRLEAGERLHIDPEGALQELRAVNTQLAKLKDALAAELRVKDEFLAVLSHELRTPLSPILGWARLLQTKYAHDPTLTRALAVIERNARLQTELVNDLLDLSRITSGRLDLHIEPVLLNDVIRGAQETLAESARERGVEVVLALAPEDPAVQGDAIRLQQVAWNLLSNAIKFSPPGSAVHVSTRVHDGRATMRVIDQGIGIAPDLLPHIFDRFRQGAPARTRSFGGLGLGLTIAKAIVERHGGELSAESSGASQGSAFTLTLDCMPGPAAGQSAAAAIAGTRLRARVLLIEDNPDTAEVYRQMLQMLGCQVLTASSGAEALCVVDGSVPDAIVSDIGLPDMDGYELLRQLRRHPEWAAVPAIALTGFASEQDQRRSALAGFRVHLSKPVTPERLARAVAAVMQRGMPGPVVP